MGTKKQNSFQLNWGATQNVPYNPNPNVNLSGANTGVMTGTNTIYSNVQSITNQDNVCLEITWTGTPTGTISVLGSESGNNFYPLTFSPALTQPAGAGGGYIQIQGLNQLPFRYLMVKYVNTSGVGVLTVWIGQKDLN